MKVNFLSILTAIAVYGRCLEIGYNNLFSVIVGLAGGVIAHFGFWVIIKTKNADNQQ